MDCSKCTLPYISDRGANKSGPNAGYAETSVRCRRHDKNYCNAPYANTNMETVRTTSTELVIRNSAAISGAAGAIMADAAGLRKV